MGLNVQSNVLSAVHGVELSPATAHRHTHRYQFGLRSLVVRIRMACSDASFGGGSLRHRQTRACSSKAWLVRVLVLCWQRESRFRGDLAGIVPGCLEFGGIFHTRGRATVRLFLFSAADLIQCCSRLAARPRSWFWKALCTGHESASGVDAGGSLQCADVGQLLVPRLAPVGGKRRISVVEFHAELLWAAAAAGRGSEGACFPSFFFLFSRRSNERMCRCAV